MLVLGRALPRQISVLPLASAAPGLPRFMVWTPLSQSPSPPSPQAVARFGTMASTSSAQPQQSSSSGGSSRFHPPSAPTTARDFLRYVDASTDPFHAVQTSSELLEAAGFKRLKEDEQWDHHLQRGGKYYFTRNGSALVAFAVGERFEPGKGGVHAVGAHTDSPCFKLKPVSKKEKVGYVQVGVETYGGGLWNTWWDRDLSISGRVIVADDASPDCATFKSRLVSIRDRPILRIPNLAIHLNRGAGDNYKFNVEENMVPILALAQKHVADQLNGSGAESAGGGSAVGDPTMQSKHAPLLLNLLASELKVDPIQIQDFELSLYDTQPASIGGARNEFINSGRLDNLMSCFCSVTALLSSISPGQSTLADSSSIRAICLFDNEEVGSVSNQGAESNMLPSLIRRLARIQVEGVEPFSGAGDGFDVALAKSFLISADMAHAIHPNYTSSYESQNSAELGKGVVIKTNYKQRYASTSATTFLLRRFAKLARTVEAEHSNRATSASSSSSSSGGIPLQEFSMRNDMPCGSTIGPLLSKSGLRTVDIGLPQLAMHSIREVCSSKDPDYLINLLESFWAHGETVLESLEVD